MGNIGITTTNRQRFVVTLESRHGSGDGETYRALRALLKTLLRRFGWRCIEIKPAGGGE